jgi:hypothetical protein
MSRNTGLKPSIPSTGPGGAGSVPGSTGGDNFPQGCTGADPSIFPPACKEDPDASLAGRPTADYSLPGMQVEPEAGYWGEGPRPLPRVPTISEVLTLTEDPDGPYYVRPYTSYAPYYDIEIEELSCLAANRNDPNAVTGDVFSKFPKSYFFGDDTKDPPWLFDLKYKRLPVSDFAQLDPPPFGAVFDIANRPQYAINDVNQQHLRRGTLPPLITNGRQLGRMFEICTPGILHRNALNYLFYKRPELGPPRQARIWMALDVTIYGALVAAWYYKWAAAPQKYSYRQRPYEYDRNRHFRVLFDDVVADDGVFDKCPRPCPCPSPGTPRHPAYPSGHSTFSSSASTILKYFFPDEDSVMQLNLLANNIGSARLWAGVHWRSDHVAGVQIGRAVAQRVIEQLDGDCVPPVYPPNPCEPPVPLPPCHPDDPPMSPPSHDELKKRATQRRNMGKCDRCHDVLPRQRSQAFDDCTPGKSIATF